MASKALISSASTLVSTTSLSSPKLAPLVPSARNASFSFSSPASKMPSSRLSMVVKAQQQSGAGHLVGPHPQTTAAPVHAAWNSTEDERWFKLRLDVPGVGAEDIDVKVEGDMLVIKDLGRQLYSPYDTKVQLPPYCIKHQTTATLDKGVLHVSVPKMLVTTTTTTQPIVVHVPTFVHVPPMTSPVIHVPIKRPMTQTHTHTHV